MKTCFRLILPALVVPVCILLSSQRSFAQTVARVTSAEKKLVIDSVCQLLRNQYVIPETGKRIAAFISDKASNGGYNAPGDPNAFADSLTADLVRVSKDLHFQVYFDPAWVSDSKASVSHSDSLALRSKRAERYRPVNYGFREINNLDGNIGYLKLTAFVDPIVAGPTVVAAMNSLSHSDALIIDIRDNPGGFKESVDLISSYLFDADRDFTLPYVPGNRMSNIPVYLLTNRYTYSAAEGFSQLLKIRKRATLVGETTGGAAHGIERKAISDRFYMNIPISRPSPDWEGTGIEPDIKVEAGQAYHTALVRALYDLSVSHPGDSLEYKWLLEDAEAQQNPVVIKGSVLDSYTGDYGNRKLFITDGRLFFQREGDQKYALAPIREDLFRFVDTDDLRLQFVADKGRITGLRIIYKDGGSKMVLRSK